MAKSQVKEKPKQESQADLASQLHKVKIRASEQNAELERNSREIKRLQLEVERLQDLDATNDDLKDQLDIADAEIKHLRAELETAREYANANEGDARKLQTIKDALK